ncbi:MAG: cytochrome P450 [Pseudaminobacter sp.]
MNQVPNRLLRDWDPRSDAVLAHQMETYDEMRRRCPVAHSDYLGWSLFRHEDVMRVLDDHHTFSNVVSSHLSVPNGMDPPEHTRYRQLIEPYFASERMEDFEPLCRAVSAELVSDLQKGAETELVTQFAQLFALRIQCAFLGWPQDLHEPLRQWIRKNHDATLARDTKVMSAIAQEFDGYIRELLEMRRKAGAAAPDDITTSLLRQEIGDRLLTDGEIVSILRNWTVGELGTIAACVGILVHYLADNPSVQERLRENPSLLPVAIDEILRIHAPLVSNRRVATKPVEIGGRKIAAGERITLMWASANRDEAVFGDPDEFRLDRDPAQNLLYGAGVHVCPGMLLARLELRILMEELLTRTKQVQLVPGKQPVRALYPASGFSLLYVQVL